MGDGGIPAGPGAEGPRVEPVKPEGRSASPVGGEAPERTDRYESLMEQVVSTDNYGTALEAVLRNRGRAGDGRHEDHRPEVREGTPQGGPLSPLLANIYLDPLDKELERRGHCFVRYADDCNVYVGGAAAADRVVRNLPKWIAKHLRLKVNANKTGVGRPWERKFLGFRINREGQIEVSPTSLKRLKRRVRQLWDARQNLSSLELRDQWQRYIRGWWNYYRLAEGRRSWPALEGWTRRHIRKCFWLRWHSWRGRLRRLRSLGVREPLLRVAHSSRGSWRIARHSALHTALSNRRLRRYGFLVPSDLG